jgi:hypothetical protein
VHVVVEVTVVGGQAFVLNGNANCPFVLPFKRTTCRPNVLCASGPD